MLELASAVGCLEAGTSGKWRLAHASEPAVRDCEATSSAELKADADAELGRVEIDLLGSRWFGPEKFKGEKVAVKGILLRAGGDYRMNVTSLQEVGPCRKLLSTVFNRAEFFELDGLQARLGEPAD